MTIFDQYKRPLKNLRLSVTDRCNLRCQYCMPEANYTWFPHDEILHYEECCRLVDLFVSLGVDKVRLTGGEPLLRRDLDVLVGMLANRPGVSDLALTTNGILLGERLGDLIEAGLGRITVSLDTLRPDRFKDLTKRPDFDRVIAGIRAVADSPLQEGFKLDTVVMRGVNDDELVEIVEFAGRYGAEARFIEYMDVGGATNWSAETVMSRAEMVEVFADHYGRLDPVAKEDSAPADQYRLPDGRTIGIISSTTQPFCGTCDRSRLTADGKWFLCLYARLGLDLKKPMRDGATNEELLALISSAWGGRTDRGAQDRLALENRAPLASAEDMRDNPHLEMHTRGG